MKETDAERLSRIAATRARAMLASLAANGEFTRIAFVQFSRHSRGRGIELWARNGISLPGEYVYAHLARPCRPAWERR